MKIRYLLQLHNLYNILSWCQCHKIRTHQPIGARPGESSLATTNLINVGWRDLLYFRYKNWEKVLCNLKVKHVFTICTQSTMHWCNLIHISIREVVYNCIILLAVSTSYLAGIDASGASPCSQSHSYASLNAQGSAAMPYLIPRTWWNYS